MLKTVPHDPYLYRRKKVPYKPKTDYTFRQKQIISGELEPSHLGELKIIIKKAKKKDDQKSYEKLSSMYPYYHQLHLETLHRYSERQISIIIGKTKPRNKKDLETILKRAAKKNDEDTLFQLHKRYDYMLNENISVRYSKEDAMKELENMTQVQIHWGEYDN